MTKTTALCEIEPGNGNFVPAREGRLLQRYDEEGRRLVAGTIPVRNYNNHATRPTDPSTLVTTPPSTSSNNNNNNNNNNNLDILLITSRSGRGGWVIPKGGWELDETIEAAALRETLEEAGVKGTLDPTPIGIFHFTSDKVERRLEHDKGNCIASIYVMHVTEEQSEWAEGHQRQRAWFPALDAIGMIRHEWMREAVRRLVAAAMGDEAADAAMAAAAEKFKRHHDNHHHAHHAVHGGSTVGSPSTTTTTTHRFVTDCVVSTSAQLVAPSTNNTHHHHHHHDAI